MTALKDMAKTKFSYMKWESFQKEAPEFKS